MISAWILFTVLAALMQAIRTAGQKQLTGTITVASATLVRYVFGLPFVIVYLVSVLQHDVASVVTANLSQFRFVQFVVLASVSQILATWLLVKVFSFRNFAVGTSFAKTEAVQAAVFGVVFFGAVLSSWGWLAVLIGFAGLFILGYPGRFVAWDARNILFGTLSGTAFAFTSLWLREASLSVGLGAVQSAAVTLFCMVCLQSVLCCIYTVVAEPVQFKLIWQSRKLSVFVGFTSAAGSVGWFTAMTYQNPALVKSLGQVEIIFTLLLSTLYFKESMTAREGIGVLAIIASVLILLVAGT